MCIIYYLIKNICIEKISDFNDLLHSPDLNIIIIKKREKAIREYDSDDDSEDHDYDAEAEDLAGSKDITKDTRRRQR